MVHSWPVRTRKPVILATLILSVLLAAACQSDQITVIPLPTDTKVAATPIQALIQTQIPEFTETTPAPDPTGDEGQPKTATSETILPPTPTASPEPTPTPPPEPSFYIVQPGDTLVGIAEQFDVTLDSLVAGNGYIALNEFALVVGNEIQIPLCETHRILSGNTVAGIAQLCGVSLDELVTANIDRLAAIGSLDAVPVGFDLYIPQESDTPDGVDCSSQPNREQVIEYEPAPGEGLFCLSQKFGVSVATLIQGNVQRLSGDEVYGDVSLLIPPIDGVLYVVTPADVESGVSVTDLADWYEVDFEAVTDWNGNPVSDPLREGQQLFVIGANLFAGVFQSQLTSQEEPGDG